MSADESGVGDTIELQASLLHIIKQFQAFSIAAPITRTEKGIVCDHTGVQSSLLQLSKQWVSVGPKSPGTNTHYV